MIDDVHVAVPVSEKNGTSVSRRFLLHGADERLERVAVVTGLFDLEEIFMAATQPAAVEPALAAGE